MQKIIELIEQVRFAELKKIDKLSNTQEEYLKNCGVCKEKSIN
ncbi:hypothetical protein QWY87_05205 [Lutimonas halocynthiae]|nr:hypothetical protein [Lutimonas halocynthiae]MDN3642087.1 hypothetical protein [Lutimonas halocynthiae]